MLERVVHAQSLAPVKLGCAVNHTCLAACFCWVLEKPKSVMVTARRVNLSTEKGGKKKEKKRAPGAGAHFGGLTVTVSLHQ